MTQPIVMENRLSQVEKALDARVRPYLRSHGGAVQVESLDARGVLGVRLLGACVGCPAADSSMHTVVRGELLDAVPELTDVVLMGSVSDHLLDQARWLLGRGAGRTVPLRLIA